MSPRLIPIVFVALLMPLMAPARANGQVGLIATTDADARVIELTTLILDEPTRVHTTTTPRDTQRLIEQARTSWREDVIVVIDVQRSLLTALRRHDATIIERRLAPSSGSSPYAVAQAVAELVVVAREAPVAVVAAVAAPSPPSTLRRRWSIAPEVGGELNASFADPLFFAGLSLGLSLHGGAARGLFGGVTLRGTPSLALSRRDGGARATYHRSDLTLEAALGTRNRNAWVALLLDATLVVVRINARFGADRDQHRRVAPWLGVGGEVAYRFPHGAYLRLGVLVGAFPDARDLQVRGRTVFREGTLQIRSFLIAGWQLF